MTKVDDPMPKVARKAIFKHRKPNTTTRKRKSGIEWLRGMLNRGGNHYSKRPDCGEHYHLECKECGGVKCGSESGYDPYEWIEQYCDCTGLVGTEKTQHLVVPFDTFGRHFGFPER